MMAQERLRSTLGSSTVRPVGSGGGVSRTTSSSSIAPVRVRSNPLHRYRTRSRPASRQWDLLQSRGCVGPSRFVRGLACRLGRLRSPRLERGKLVRRARKLNTRQRRRAGIPGM